MKVFKILLISIILLNLISCNNTNETVQEKGFYGIVYDDQGNPLADADVCIIPITPYDRYIINKENTDNTIQSTEVAELISFNSKQYVGYNEIKWSTASEMNVDRFELQRSIKDNQLDFKIINTQYSTGNSSKYKSYSFKDESIENGKTYYYRLVIYDKDGTSNKSESIVVNSQLIITKFYPVFPNPFKNYITIPISIAEKQTASLEIVENATQKKYFSITQELEYGQYEFQWVPKNIESLDTNRPLRPGVYNAFLKTKDSVFSQSLLMMFRFDTLNCNIPLEVTKTDKDGKFFIPYNWFPDSQLITFTTENGQINGKFLISDTSRIIARKIIESNSTNTSYQVAQQKFYIDRSISKLNSLTGKKYIIKK